MSLDLSPVVTATAHWLVTAYPAAGGAFGAAVGYVQARQAATVAAWLRYPTAIDAALVCLVGPGGSARLDGLMGIEHPEADSDSAWRTWVDETVASWAACLLTDGRLAAAAVDFLPTTQHGADLPFDFTRLLEPDERDRAAAALLRHPDLLAPVANLHRDELIERLLADPVDLAGAKD